MSATAKRIGLFFTVYGLAFLVFSLRSHAQTSPAPTTPPPAYGGQPSQPSQRGQVPSSNPNPQKALTGPQATAIRMAQPQSTPSAAMNANTAANAATAAAGAPAQPPPKTVIVTVPPPAKGYKKVFATISTSMGDIKILLFHAQVPHTVENFVALAEGTKEFTDLKTKEPVKRPFYDGLTFHRVRKNFVIQAGDQAGDGTGSPGFTIKDEFHPDLKHRKAGMVSMANNGADTGNTQFFITLSEQKDFDKRYPVFGEVIGGMDVVNKIGNVKTNRMTEKPVTPITITKITINRE